MPNIPPELMKLMQGQGPGAQPTQAPVSSPMSTPQQNKGEQQGAMTQVQMAMDLLEQTLPAFGSETEEGSTVLKALQALGTKFASKREKGRELIPSEIMNLVASMPKGAGAMPAMPAPGVQGPGATPPMM